MSSSAQFLNPAEAARRLGVSPKALRLYEERGLVAPVRTAAGWRTYGPAEMARAAEIAALRALGLSLSQIASVIAGDGRSLEPALAAHQSMLEAEVRRLVETAEKVRSVRAQLAEGGPTIAGELVPLVRPVGGIDLSFELPWPWGGERFELSGLPPLTYIIGPLGSGKTRLAKAIAQNLPKAAFVGLDRLENESAGAYIRLDADTALKSRVDESLAWLVEDGATVSPALVALLAKLDDGGTNALVVDMVEQGLDRAAQEALIARLRHRGGGARPLFLMTRSSSILDLAAVTRNEAIILCPANHSPPTRVAPYPGAPGFEAVATCLATPEVRARTVGVITAASPQAAGA
ncbi:MerR family transcriptional regulator [Devosia geojensis]|uniref:MerR family transcriptional regulator n=1 Tax=Devosia geojensis TaxID=443610 RepID=A0A0F5FSC5_9HYPH|nr:MerR family transcriptional regulator [Devosia geojensis]KKB11490.1 MerR family transcriptional regulator [Devosia geojensis]